MNFLYTYVLFLSISAYLFILQSSFAVASYLCTALHFHFADPSSISPHVQVFAIPPTLTWYLPENTVHFTGQELYTNYPTTPEPQTKVF